MSAMPWDKWFWTDYEADEGLRMCTLAAQGLWVRMLSLMARATPKGDLRVGGEPCTVEDLSRSVGAPEETVATLLAELERRGVFSRTRAGVIFNRRMRKDAEISLKRARAGAKGAYVTNRRIKENPDLPQQNSGKGVGNGSGKSPAPEARSQSSVDKSTGGEPPQIDYQKRAFDLAVEVLGEKGTAPPQARSLAGKWRKVAGDQRLGDLLEQAREKADPVEWVAAAVNNRGSEQDALFRAIDLKYSDAPAAAVGGAR